MLHLEVIRIRTFCIASYVDGDGSFGVKVTGFNADKKTRASVVYGVWEGDMVYPFGAGFGNVAVEYGKVGSFREYGRGFGGLERGARGLVEALGL